jgi:hypothetical protein
VIAALAATVGLTAPSRDALIERWVHANPTHAAARLQTPVRAVPAPPDLQSLAQRELAVPGRYQLSAPAIAHADPWWLRPLRWVHDRLDAMWRALFGRVHVGERTAIRIGDVLLVLAGLALLCGIWLALRNVVRARSSPRINAEALGGAPDAQSLYRDACAASNRGDYGAAAVLLFAATIALLDGRGTIASGSSATVGDLRRALRSANADLVPPFDAVAAPFVERAYADRTVAEPQWQVAERAFLYLSAASV